MAPREVGLGARRGQPSGRFCSPAGWPDSRVQGWTLTGHAGYTSTPGPGYTTSQPAQGDPATPRHLSGFWLDTPSRWPAPSSQRHYLGRHPLGTSASSPDSTSPRAMEGQMRWPTWAAEDQAPFQWGEGTQQTLAITTLGTLKPTAVVPAPSLPLWAWPHTRLSTKTCRRVYTPPHPQTHLHFLLVLHLQQKCVQWSMRRRGPCLQRQPRKGPPTVGGCCARLRRFCTA